MTPYFTARMPPALVATFPPIDALFSPGNTGYTRSCCAVTSSSWSSVTPGSTTATWFSVSISRMRFIRSNETTIPSSRGTQAPDRPVAEPRAVTGIPISFAIRRTAATSAAVPGRTTAAGRRAATVSASSWV